MAKTENNLLSKIVPAPGYVFVEPDEQAKQTVSGIYLPDNATGDKPQTGTVISVGADLEKATSPAKVGAKVIYKEWGVNEVKIENKKYLFVKFEDILATYVR